MELFRYDREYPCFDEPQNNMTVKLKSYKVISQTMKGYWISIPYGKKKFVLMGSGKRFAYETKEKALDNFIRRSKKSIAYSKMNLRNAEMALELALKIDINTLKK